ncbi:MAG: hypothetical protein AB9880_00130 [Christensenellales bacterium]
MNALVIKFQDTIPPLTDDEFSQLEKNILADGIRDPLIVWGAVLALTMSCEAERSPTMPYLLRTLRRWLDHRHDPQPIYVTPYEWMLLASSHGYRARRCR